MSDDVTRLAEVLCRDDDSWHHHEATDDYPCWHCKAKASALLASEWLAERDALNRLLGATQAKSDAIDAHAELVARMEALCGPCENYATPGQDCITAGPEVFAAEACTSCVIRAALNDPTEETTP